MKKIMDIDIIGFSNNRLTVIRVVGRNPARKIVVYCSCQCGQFTTLILSDLRNGHTKSCGCIHKETSTKKMKAIRHLGERNRLRHGASKDPEYYIWRSMKARCNNPKQIHYRSYGGRGIKVCDAWEKSFDTFISDMGKRPTTKHQLDRIDNDGNYSKDNCKWSTPTEQQRNKRNNRIIEFNGETLTESEWCQRLGISRGSVSNRIRKGWPLHRAVTTFHIPRNLRNSKKHL